MTIRLPAHLHAWTMSDESRIAFSCGNNQKSRNGIHAVAQTFSPLKYPIHGGRHTVRQRRLYTRVDVDKVDGPWPCRGDDAKIVALRKQGIERTESIRPRIVATGSVCPCAKSWFQRKGREAITGFRCHGPRPDTCGSNYVVLEVRYRMLRAGSIADTQVCYAGDLFPSAAQALDSAIWWPSFVRHFEG